MIHTYTKSILLVLVFFRVILADGVVQAAKSYLDGTIRIGVDLDMGGAITFLGLPDGTKNVVNSWDLGREIQQSYYSGPFPFHPPGVPTHPTWPNWPWNPVQAGSGFGDRSTVLEWSNNGSELYVKTGPMQWALQNYPADCIMEQWITLNGKAATVRNRLTNARSDTTQYVGYAELPAMYTNTFLTHLVTYNGTQPFTNGATTEVVNPANPTIPPFRATEGWAAYVDDNNWGVGIFHPVARSFGGKFVGSAGGGPSSYSTGIIQPIMSEIFDHNIVYDWSYDLILGDLDDIRSHAYANKPEVRPDYRFNNDRQHFIPETYGNGGISDAGVHNGVWHVEWDAGTEPDLVGPECAFQAVTVPKLHIRARYPTGESGTARVQWEGNNGDLPFAAERAYNFQVVGDGQYHTYELDLSSNPYYTGMISRLLFDPKFDLAAGSVDIAYICFGQPGTIETICNDGLDNNADGLTDCDDPDCEADPHCGPPYPDLDADGDVDQSDFGQMQVCLTESYAWVDPECEYADFDEDGHVDQSDVETLMNCMAGANVPAGQGCTP